VASHERDERDESTERDDGGLEEHVVGRERCSDLLKEEEEKSTCNVSTTSVTWTLTSRVREARLERDFTGSTRLEEEEGNGEIGSRRCATFARRRREDAFGWCVVE
jgi:hypothetical protein